MLAVPPGRLLPLPLLDPLVVRPLIQVLLRPFHGRLRDSQPMRFRPLRYHFHSHELPPLDLVSNGVPIPPVGAVFQEVFVKVGETTGV